MLLTCFSSVADYHSTPGPVLGGQANSLLPGWRPDGRVLYPLVGDLSGFEVGDHVSVEGGIAESALCPQGATIEVLRIRAGEVNQ